MPKAKPSNEPGLRTADYIRLALFRRALRRFLHFSESASARVGLTGQHYQAMLVVRAVAPDVPVMINDLARELLIKHNSAVGLVDRLVAQDLLARESLAQDRRKVRLRLTRKGELTLGRLASVHRQELQGARRTLHRVLGQLIARRASPPSASP